jgi:small multidrug resistance pump
MKRWVLLAGAILTEVTASLSLSAAMDLPALYAVVVVGYLAAFLLLALVLREGMSVGVAYGIWGALGVSLTAVLAAVLFGDPLTPTMLLGIGLVIAGVLTIELGSQRAQARREAQPDPGEEAAAA